MRPGRQAAGGMAGTDGAAGRRAPTRSTPHPAPVFEIKAKGKAFVDFQHDVTADDVRLAHREGFVSVEHLKRYTTLGMATDQGKTSNVPGLAIMAEALGKPIPDVGTTRFRPPFAPVSIGSLAAERYGDLRPERLTPMHDWHVEHGATMYSAGLWYRPMIYGHARRDHRAGLCARGRRPCARAAGIVDVSTLGKIAVQGPDAADFLDRVYTNIFSTLPVGKARYGLMLREDGLAIDDGTTWRLGENDFLMTTTTANAGKVMQHLEYLLDVIWPDLKVHLTSVTDQWAGAAIGGPKAREILAACVTGTAVDNEALPFMGIVQGEIAGAPVMICRLSFSGEMAFEVYSGAGHGTHVWEALIEAGKPFGLVPYGLEALGTHAHREGPRHRRRNRRPHHRARPASRLDAVEEEAFRRLDDDGPRRPGRARPPAACRHRVARQPAAERRRAYRRSRPTRTSPHNSHRPHHGGLLFAGARQIYRAGAGQGRQVAPRHARLYLRSAAQALRAGRDRQPPFLRSGREPHAWLTSFHR